MIGGVSIKNKKLRKRLLFLSISLMLITTYIKNYKYSDNYKEINIFYVTNGDEIYVFDIEESLPKQETISEQVTVSSEE